MIKKIIKSNNNTLTFRIPDRYVGKQIEIIAYEVTEASENINEPENPKEKKFNTIKLKTKEFNFNRDEANER